MTAHEMGNEEKDHLDDVFALLGNETRMTVLRVLWDERDPFASTEDNALSFTEVRERVGMDDPGQFNYHLNRLVGTFLARTDAGYVLRPNAANMLRAAVVRSGIGDVSVPPSRADDPCPFCGADVEVFCEDGQLTARCTECPGEYESEVSPEGTLMSTQAFPPPGLEGRRGQDLWEALSDYMATFAFGFLAGVCPECAARPAVSVDACLDHEADGICEECGSTQAALATVHCESCSVAWRLPAWGPALTHPEVIWFFHGHGLDAAGGLTLDTYNTLLTASETIRSADPLRLAETVELDGDELVVVVDDELTVREVHTGPVDD